MTPLRMSMDALLSMGLLKSKDLSTTLFTRDGLCFEVSTYIGIDHPMTNNRKVTLCCPPLIYSIQKWAKSRLS